MIKPLSAASFRFGSHAFVATLLLCLLTALVVWWLLPTFSFVFGSGWMPPLLLGLLFFAPLLLWHKVWLRQLYKKGTTEGDAALLEYFVQQNALESEEEQPSVELLENALQFKKVSAGDCITPRDAIVHIDIKANWEALHALYVASKRTRILVTNGSLDQVKGYIHARQLFGQPATVASMVRPLSMVADTTALDDLLQHMIRTRQNIVGVVEDGGTFAGILTLEDVLEPLFGDINED
jgi:CBS domain containing-hemolysin-like protein